MSRPAYSPRVNLWLCAVLACGLALVAGYKTGTRARVSALEARVESLERRIAARDRAQPGRRTSRDLSESQRQALSIMTRGER